MRREIMRPYVLRLKIRRTIDTYLDIQSLGIGKPRQTYASADLKIRARTKLSNIELMNEYIRARGLNPEQTLTRELLAEGATIHTGEELQDYQVRILRDTFSDLVCKDVEETIRRPGQTSKTGGIRVPRGELRTPLFFRWAEWASPRLVLFFFRVNDSGSKYTDSSFR